MSKLLNVSQSLGLTLMHGEIPFNQLRKTWMGVCVIVGAMI